MKTLRLILAARDLFNAAKVLALTPATVTWLAANDPNALRQLRAAIAKAE